LTTLQQQATLAAHVAPSVVIFKNCLIQVQTEFHKEFSEINALLTPRRFTLFCTGMSQWNDHGGNLHAITLKISVQLLLAVEIVPPASEFLGEFLLQSCCRT
jgi:hypothetical protein